MRGYGAQLRLCLRVTVAALAAFILAQVFTAPLAGLWAVLTAVLVTQVSLGASVTATIEYFVGTLGGAIYAGAIAVVIRTTEKSLSSSSSRLRSRRLHFLRL